MQWTCHSSCIKNLTCLQVQDEWGGPTHCWWERHVAHCLVKRVLGISAQCLFPKEASAPGDVPGCSQRCSGHKNKRSDVTQRKSPPGQRHTVACPYKTHSSDTECRRLPPHGRAPRGNAEQGKGWGQGCRMQPWAHPRAWAPPAAFPTTFQRPPAGTSCTIPELVVVLIRGKQVWSGPEVLLWTF